MTDPDQATRFTVGDFIHDEFEARGWSRVQFVALLGLRPKVGYRLLRGEERVTPEIAARLASVFGTSETLWVKLDAAYREKK